MENKRILIIDGPSITKDPLSIRLRDIFKFHKISVETILFEDINTKILDDENIISVVLPAIHGEKSPYKEYLSDDSRYGIHEYVRKGGVVLGFCAGAYEISKAITYRNKDNSIKSRDDTFSFINMDSYGPVMPPDQSHTSNPRDLVLMPVTFRDIKGNIHETMSLYHCGPTLSQGEIIDIETAAYFNHLSLPLTALGKKEYEEGLVIFSSILPYFAADDIPDGDKFLNYNGMNLLKLKRQMEPYEEKRKMIMDWICYQIYSHNVNTGRIKPKMLVNEI